MTQVQKEMQVCFYPLYSFYVEKKRNEDSLKELNGCIDISHPKFDAQSESKEKSCLLLGQAEMSDGFHSDLLQTLMHNAPVMSVCFSLNSA